MGKPDLVDIDQDATHEIIRMGFRPLRTTIGRGNRIYEAVKEKNLSEEVKQLAKGKTRVYFVLKKNKRPVLHTDLLAAQDAAAVSPDTHWMKISRHALDVVRQRANYERKKKNMDHTTVWNIRLTEAIVDVMSLDFIPVFWHSCGSHGGPPDKDPIIIEALKDKKRMWFYFLFGKQGRPAANIKDAKDATGIDYLMSQTMNDGYLGSLVDKVEQAKKRQAARDEMAAKEAARPAPQISVGSGSVFEHRSLGDPDDMYESEYFCG